MSIKIREAHLLDLGQIIKMQENHKSEVNAFGLLTFNKEKCIMSMATVINDVGHTVLVAHKENSSKLLGYIWLAAVAPHYSDDWYYLEQYTYVLPELRGGSVLNRLLLKAKDIANYNGASYLHIGSFSGDDKLTAAYMKRYKVMGTVFIIELDKE